MLLSFTVSGFASYKEPQTLFLTPESIRVKKLYSDNYHIVGKGKNKLKIMKSAVIFGGNATGKTNLLLALQVLQYIILAGNIFVNYNPQQDQRPPMLFARNDESKSIVFMIEILGEDNKIYTYEVEYNSERAIREALFVGEEPLFEYNAEKGRNQDYDKWHLQSNIKQISREYIETFFTGTGFPYIKKLEDEGIEEVNIFRKSISKIRIRMNHIFNPLVKGLDMVLDEKEKKEFEAKDNKSLLINIFRKLDCTIEDFEFFRMPSRKEEYSLGLIRGNKKVFSIGYEAEGIKKIYSLALSLLRMLINGEILLVDELDSSISARSLIEIFRDIIHSEYNRGQLIVTTHNVSLFNNVILDPEQIYICDKQKECFSTIEPLSIYKGVYRGASEKIMKEFLQGRFGGIHG